MGTLTRKLLGILFIVCLVGTPVGLFADWANKPRNQRLSSQRENPQIILSGTVVRFREYEDLVVEDANGRVQVQFANPLQPLRLKVGEEVTIVGQYKRNRNGDRQLIADAIKTRTQKITKDKRNY